MNSTILDMEGFEDAEITSKSVPAELGTVSVAKAMSQIEYYPFP